MKAKIPLLVGGAVGYVLGTRAGRERYEQIKSQAQTLWNNPKVQEKAWAAQDFAKEKGADPQGQGRGRCPRGRVEQWAGQQLQPHRTARVACRDRR
ncbi:MAG TPA: YtxH domain-containing protein [Nocardioidaceae bacterium]|nr:YtxH domain-containing protein [Nocardioidaceae bacterium]